MTNHSKYVCLCHVSDSFVRRHGQSVKVTGLLVSRAHIAGQYADPHFKDSELGLGAVVLISNIRSSKYLDLTWRSLLFRIVGGTLISGEGLPEDFVACVRAKDETTRDVSVVN